MKNSQSKKRKIVKLKLYILVVFVLHLLILAGCNNSNQTGNTVETTGSNEESRINQVTNDQIHQAAMNGQLPVVMNLLSEGLNVNGLDQDGRTALMYASFNGHAVIMSKLIEKGALINLQDLYGRTALMLASSGPYPDAVKILLDNKADPDIADTEEHFTALMYASAEGQLEVVKLLLSYKADPALKDVDGDDALKFAVNNNHKEIVALLKSRLN